MAVAMQRRAVAERGARGGAGAFFLVAVVAEIYLRGVCSCHSRNIETRNGAARC
jgi:hypothetical protein